jgi:hypothetical protein
MYHIGGGILLALEHKHAMNCVCTVWSQCSFFCKFLRKLFQEQVIEEGAYVMLNLFLFLPSSRSELFNVVSQLFFLLESLCV